MSSIKLLQLPIPEVHHLYTEGNVPLAAGYLKAHAVANGVVDARQIDILPRERFNNAGDAAILKWINDGDTTIVGFTSYMWNVQRNLYLAKKIKEMNPNITVVMGGPEITHDHRALNDDNIDCLVIGEGENVFLDLLKNFQQGNRLERVYVSTKVVDLSEVPNPYLEGMLEPVKGESIFLETMRGCPYPCKYCFYSKSFSCLRYFPENQLPRLFELARERGVEEIYFMDPSFNVAPGLKEKLERIAKLNSTGIVIHTETRLESITPEIAESMRAAGFGSVEAGLQSTNQKSLDAIARKWHRGRFIQGAQLMRQNNIDVKTGVILGLPFDTGNDFEETLDFVMQLGLDESMEIYPLSLIPGTQLREEAASYGLNFMPHPPYWVTSTPFMTEREMKQTVEMVEQKLGIEFFPPIIPLFRNVQAGLMHYLDLREKAGCQLDTLFRFPEKVGQSLTIRVNEDTNRNLLTNLGHWLREFNPFTLVQLVLEQDFIPKEEEMKPLIDAFYQPDHYFNHIHHYKIDNQGIYSLRFFHLTSNLDAADSYLYKPLFCDLILLYSSQLLAKGKDILEEKPILLVDTAISEPEKKELQEIYTDFENFLIY